MNSIVTLALKDLRVLSRDYFGLFWMFGFPLMFALFFGAIFAGMGSGTTSALAIAMVDEDKSQGSQAFVARLKETPALKLQEFDMQEAADKVLHGNLVGYVRLKRGFGDNVGFMGGTDVFVEVGIDPSRKAEKEMVRGILLEASFASMQDLVGKPDRTAAQMAVMRTQIEGRQKTCSGRTRKEPCSSSMAISSNFWATSMLPPRTARMPKPPRVFKACRLTSRR